MCFAPQRRALFRDLNLQKWREHVVFCYILTSKCASRHNGVHFFDIATSKSGRSWCVLYILTSKCASRHNSVHFFDIATSKSGLKLVCFIHFDIEMCFAPHRRALFRHLNFQKWSDNGVFWTFWLGNVLRATSACTFSSLIWMNQFMGWIGPNLEHVEAPPCICGNWNCQTDLIYQMKST